MKKAPLSLCMIVKDAEKTLAQAVNSVRTLVSDIVIVDTGSSDQTVSCAEELGARVFSYTWHDDFSAARNVSLHHAKADWILVLDADECIAAQDLKYIEEAVREPRADAYTLIQRTYCMSADVEGWRANTTTYREGQGYAGFYDVPMVRLFRNCPDIRFHGFVHETVDASLKGYKKRYVDVPIHHFTQLENSEERMKKSQRYLGLLLKQLEHAPEDSTTWFLLGRQYFTLGKYPEAIAFLKQVYDQGTKCEMVFDNLAAAYVECGLYEDAAPVLEALLKLNPRYAEAYSTLGVVYYSLQKKEEALAAFRHAISLAPDAFKPYFNMAATLYRETRYQEAEQYLMHARAQSPDNQRVLYLHFHILDQLGKYADALACGKHLQRLQSPLFVHIERRMSELEPTTISFQGVIH